MVLMDQFFTLAQVEVWVVPLKVTTTVATFRGAVPETVSKLLFVL